ncbi:MAG: HAD-IC family P-type ATPase, partial [Kangiellaceae bacterium]|nr:HAD-IC family P-type ATPase [Kangiellaceae bacterium]
MSHSAATVTGLTSSAAAKQRAVDGLNQLPQPKPPNFFALFLRQFKSPFIYVLLLAAIVSFFLQHQVNAIFIFAVLLLNALIGSIQEYSAERAAQALNAMVPSLANVYRDGHLTRIETTDIVVGDIVALASGDKIPADGIVIQTNQLTVNESVLTGESLEIIKSPAGFESAINLEPIINLESTADEKFKSTQANNICFAGGSVVRGRALIEIIATGSNTEIGKIAQAVVASDITKPPLLQRIERFTFKVTIATLVVISAIFVIGIMRGEPLAQVFLLGVALAVSAIPEGLPAAITVTLAIGMRRMAKRNVIVRSLLAVESLGSCTFIASDKTGTLTVNDMTVQKVLLPDGSEFDVTGEGIDAHGEVIGVHSKVVGADDNQNDVISQTNDANTALKNLCKIGVLANESEFYFKDGLWQAQGDQVDVSLLVLQNKLGTDHQKLLQQHQSIAAIPYESENAFSASLNHYHDQYLLSVKGSAEKLIAMSNLTQQQKDSAAKQVSQLAQHGYRVLAFASKPIKQVPHQLDTELKELQFAGLVGIIDPLRSEAITAVSACRKACIEVAMITGDHPETAKAIAQRLGMIMSDDSVVTGKQIAELADTNSAALKQCILDN